MWIQYQDSRWEYGIFSHLLTQELELQSKEIVTRQVTKKSEEKKQKRGKDKSKDPERATVCRP